MSPMLGPLDDVLTGEHEPPRSQILWIHRQGQH